MVSDPIADTITRIRNGYMAGNSVVEVPFSRLKQSLAELLVKANYLSQSSVKDRTLILKLKYDQKQPAITDIKRVSKPSLRVYVGKNNLPKVLGGMGTAVISTPVGLMTDREARKKGFGGEVICEVF